MRTCPGHLILYLRKCVIQASSGTHMQPDGGEKGLLSNLRWVKKPLLPLLSAWWVNERVIHTGMQNRLPCVRRQGVMGSVRLTGWSNNRQTDAHAALPWKKKGKILFYLQSKQQGESRRRGVCSCTNRFLYEFPSHLIISLRKRKSASSSFRTVQACYSLWRQCRVLFDYAPLKSIAPSPQGARNIKDDYYVYWLGRNRRNFNGSSTFRCRRLRL